jgi:hypothetical protein
MYGTTRELYAARRCVVQICRRGRRRCAGCVRCLCHSPCGRHSTAGTVREVALCPPDPPDHIGKATSLKRRMLGNELRGRGHGTFFRSMGAVLGHRPLAGSLATKANKYNFSFQKQDRDSIVEWINTSLEVNWAVLPRMDAGPSEAVLIRDHAPLLNLDGNPRALVELDELRKLCQRLASRPASLS